MELYKVQMIVDSIELSALGIMIAILAAVVILIMSK